MKKYVENENEKKVKWECGKCHLPMWCVRQWGVTVKCWWLYIAINRQFLWNHFAKSWFYQPSQALKGCERVQPTNAHIPLRGTVWQPYYSICIGSPFNLIHFRRKIFSAMALSDKIIIVLERCKMMWTQLGWLDYDCFYSLKVLASSAVFFKLLGLTLS